MAKAGMNPTGRRPYAKRTSGFKRKKQTSNNKTMSLFATASQASRIPRSYFSSFPNQFRINLKANFTENVNITTLLYERTFDLHVPGIKTGGSLPTCLAGGLLPLMYIYQRVQVLKVKFRVRIENLGFAIGTLTYGENAYQYSSVIWTQKQANDAVTAGVTSFDEYRTSVGSHYKTMCPAPGAPNFIEDTQSVDVVNFLGGDRLDHSQSSYFSNGPSNFLLQTPASASTYNMPAFVFAMQRNTATTGQLRIYYEADFSCEFTNVRPLEQVPSAMKLFAVA